jgi:hypothetical protein
MEMRLHCSELQLQLFFLEPQRTTYHKASVVSEWAEELSMGQSKPSVESVEVS